MVTGSIFNSLIFGGVNSADYGIYITGEAVYNAPKRAVELIAVPGRNGDVALDLGHFENIEVTYPAGCYGDDKTDFRERISDFRNAVISQKGYQRLTDTYHPEEYRLGLYSEGLEVKPTMSKAGEFELVFNCKPQRYLTSGESAVTIGEWGETETVSGEIAEFEGNVATGIKSVTVALDPIQSLNGYDKPWVGGAGKNKLPSPTATSKTVNGITISVNDGVYSLSGTATAAAEIIFDLPSTVTYDGNYKCAFLNDKANSGVVVYWRNGNTNGTSMGMGAVNRVAEYSAQASFNKVRFLVSSGTAISGTMKISPVLCLKSETTPTAFEPYSNICPISGRTEVTAHVSPTTTGGITYTTNLGRTVYGGTLDVVSGKLTVTHVSVEFDGSESWSWSSNRASIALSGAPTGAYSRELMSNYLVPSATTAATPPWTALINSNGILLVGTENVTSLAEWKTFVSNNHLQVVYPLATPQIYNVSTRLVKAIVGTNNVWSEQGPVTVEFGLDPNKLYNPTQFDAHPLLAVTGSGRVMFGDYTVAIYDQDLGTIDLGDQSNSRTTGSITTGDILVDASWLNNGDLATIGSTRLVLDTNLDMRYSNVVVDTRSGDLTIEAGASGVNKLALTVGATDIAFGSSAVSISGTADVRIVDKRTQAISRVTVQIKLMTYTSGYRRINAAATVTPQTMTAPNITLSVSKWSIGIYNVSAYSTASALGNPTYIDCEIGEAYKYMGDKLMTLNGLIAFGSDLPSLPPGATEITKDPTITDLKITPRWWKI